MGSVYGFGLTDSILSSVKSCAASCPHPAHGEERQPRTRTDRGRNCSGLKAKSSLFGIIQVAEKLSQRLKVE